MSYKLRRGFFQEVNGFSVTKHAGGLPSTTYTKGHAQAILFHYTAGCGSDIHDVLKARGISVTFCVARDGTIFQYLRFGTAGWHAFGMSHFAVGIEHSALPGTCEITDQQLAASRALSAAIVELSKRKYGQDIPLRKLEAPVTMFNVQPGFFDHRDGDSSWNENGHTDHLVGQSWDNYLQGVSNILTPPVVITVEGRKGDKTFERVFGEMAKALAFVREKVRKGFRITRIEKGPKAGPEG